MYIYIGTNKINGKQYVGQSINDPHEGRIKEHKRANGRTRALHRAIHKHGFENFTWEVIHYPGASQEALNAIEQWHITKRNTLSPGGYNLNTGGNQGGSHSAETRARMSEAKKGENHPNYGKNLSAETRANIGKTSKGRTHSTETRARMSETRKGENHPNYGRTFSAEIRARMSKGKKDSIHSAETRAKMSESHKGRVVSAETRTKMSEAHKKRRHNPNQITISF